MAEHLICQEDVKKEIWNFFWPSESESTAYHSVLDTEQVVLRRKLIAGSTKKISTKKLISKHQETRNQEQTDVQLVERKTQWRWEQKQMNTHLKSNRKGHSNEELVFVKEKQNI